MSRVSVGLRVQEWRADPHRRGVSPVVNGDPTCAAAETGHGQALPDIPVFDHVKLQIKNSHRIMEQASAWFIGVG